MPPSNGEYFKHEQLFNKWFTKNDYLVVSVDCDDIYSADSLKLITDVSTAVKDLPDISGIASYTTVIDSDKKSDNKILKSDLVKKFLISRDSKTQNIFIFFDHNYNHHQVVTQLFEILNKFNRKGIYVSGNSMIEYYVEIEIVHDFLKLGILSIIIIFLTQVLFCNSFVIGAIFLLSSMLSVLWTIALFPLMHIAFEPATMVIPLIAIVLSTSYSIHLYNYFQVEKNNTLTQIIDYSFLIIGMAALTTVIGFGTLIFSPILLLRKIGLLLIFSIFFSFLITLFLIPNLLKAIDQPKRKINIIKLDSILPNRYLYIFLIIIPVVTFGVHFIQLSNGFKYYFKKDSTVDKEISQEIQRANGIYYLNIVIDTGKEYGLVDSDTYNAIVQLADELRYSSKIKSVLSFTDFLSWSNGILYGDGTSLQPENENEIGEILEMFNSLNYGFNINAFIDISYSKAALQITYGDMSLSNKGKDELLKNLESEVSKTMKKYFPDGSWFFISANHHYEDVLLNLLKNLLPSTIIIIVVLFLVLLAVFKSVKLTAVSLIPAVTSTLVFFGIMGWFRFNLDIENIMLLAIIIGVSSDDVIMFLIAFRHRTKTHYLTEAIIETKKETGLAILQTTLIIIISISVMFFSNFTNFTGSILLFIISLSSSTFITLTIIPIILRLIYKNRMEILQ